jgi:hypothetical protein
MATQAMGNQETEGLGTPAFSVSLAGMVESCEAEEQVEGDAVCFSTGKALRGARGFLFALGLEGGMLVAAFLVWQAVRSLR